MEDICLFVQLVSRHQLRTSGTHGFVLGTGGEGCANGKFWSLISRCSKSSERIKR